MIRQWSILIRGTGAEVICPLYQNLWLYFTWLRKPLLALYHAIKTLCHKSLKVLGTKICSYFRAERKSKYRNKTRKYWKIYFIHICYIKYIIFILHVLCIYNYIYNILVFELNHILYRFLVFREFQMHKMQNLESIYTIWNYFIMRVPNTTSESKGVLSKFSNQK